MQRRSQKEWASPSRRCSSRRLPRITRSLRRSSRKRYRGVHQLQRDENGLEKCVACFLCAAACPADCIYIEAAENTDQLRISGGERYAKVYNIDYNRCIFCGFCVEACPTDAITHGHGFEIASYNTSTLIYRKEQMLVPIPQRAPTSPRAEEPLRIPPATSEGAWGWASPAGACRRRTPPRRGRGHSGMGLRPETRPNGGVCPPQGKLNSLRVASTFFDACT